MPCTVAVCTLAATSVIGLQFQRPHPILHVHLHENRDPSPHAQQRMQSNMTRTERFVLLSSRPAADTLPLKSARCRSGTIGVPCGWLYEARGRLCSGTRVINNTARAELRMVCVPAHRQPPHVWLCRSYVHVEAPYWGRSNARQKRSMCLCGQRGIMERTQISK